MEMRQITLFIAVAEEGHFGRAAERMSVAQPALSQHVRRLERYLGEQLFDRSSLQVRLTPAGEAFLEVARRVSRYAAEAAATPRAATLDLTDSQVCDQAVGRAAPRALQRAG